jgi:hypothetical protein
MALRLGSGQVSLAGSLDLRRYSRHLLIPEVGLAGQEKLGGGGRRPHRHRR